MRIIFLDLDGVLNSRSWYDRRGPLPPDPDYRAHLAHAIDPQCLAWLNQLCVATGARLVFSSTWRKGYTLRRLNADFRGLGCTGRFIGITPTLRGQPRGAEIAAWLSGYGPITSCVILDDDADMDALLPRLVQTSRDTGLTEADVNRAVALLTARP